MGAEFNQPGIKLHASVGSNQRYCQRRSRHVDMMRVLVCIYQAALRSIAAAENAAAEVY